MATYDALLVDDNVFTSQVIGSGEFGEVKSARAYVQRGEEPISAQLDLSKLERDESGEWPTLSKEAECSEEGVSKQQWRNH